MKNNCKNYTKKFVMFFCINFFYGSSCLLSQEHSFDVLFPKTWYEKGYNALSSTWYLVQDDEVRCEGFSDHPACFEVLIGRLAFAYFCIKKIQKKDNFMHRQDVVYLETLVQNLKKIFSAISFTEYVQCCAIFLNKIEKVLS